MRAPCRSSHKAGKPTANSRKTGLPVNETAWHRRLERVVVDDALVQPLRPALVERGQRAVAGHLMQEQAEGHTDEDDGDAEKQLAQAVPALRGEFGGGRVG